MTSTNLSESSGTTSIVVKALLSIAVLGFLFSMVSPRELVHAWSGASWDWIAGAVVLTPVHLLLRAFRWRSLLAGAGEPVEAARAFRSVMVGYAFAVSTPAEVGEIAARVRMHDGVAGPRILGLVLVEKVLHSLLILIPGIPALVLYLWGDPLTAWLALVAILVIVVSAALGTPRLLLLRFDETHPRLAPLARTLREIGTVQRRTLASLALATIAILLVYVVQEYLLLNAVTDLGITETWNGFWAGMSVRTLVPIFVMDLGIREASHVLFFGRYGVDASAAMAVSLLMFCINILLPSLAGLAFLFRKEAIRS